MDIEEKRTLLKQLFIDDFTSEIILSIENDIDFIKSVFKNCSYDDFTNDNLEKMKYYMKYHNLKKLCKYIFEISFWVEFEIPFNEKPKDKDNEYFLIGDYLLNKDVEFLSENMFYMSYDYDTHSNLFCEIKIGKHILDNCKCSIIYEKNLLRLHIFNY